MMAHARPSRLRVRLSAPIHASTSAGLGSIPMLSSSAQLGADHHAGQYLHAEQPLVSLHGGT